MKRKQIKAADPLLRGCAACGALIGQGCRTVLGDARPLVPYASRLVHADRIEQPAPKGTHA